MKLVRGRGCRPIRLVEAYGVGAGHGKGLWIVGQLAPPPNWVGGAIRGQWPGEWPTGGWQLALTLIRIRRPIWGGASLREELKEVGQLSLPPNWDRVGAIKGKTIQVLELWADWSGGSPLGA